MKRDQTEECLNRVLIFNRHHITPRSRGGSDADWNILRVPINLHKAWHEMTSCLCLSLEEIIILLPYWMDSESGRTRKNILGGDSRGKFCQFKELIDYHDLTVHELTALIKLCYADEKGEIDFSRMRIRQARSFRKIFGKEKRVDEIINILENQRIFFSKSDKEAWHRLTCSLCLRFKEVKVLFSCWIDTGGNLRSGLSEQTLRRLQIFRNDFNLRPGEFILLLKRYYSDGEGRLDFSKLRIKQKAALRKNLFDGKVFIKEIIEQIENRWMTKEWKEKSCFKIKDPAD